MTPPGGPGDTAFAFSAHPDPAVATGEVIGALHASGAPVTTVLGLFAGTWPTGSRPLAWRTVCRILRPQVAVAGALPEIFHPRSEVPGHSDRKGHRSLAVIATGNRPSRIVAGAAGDETTAGAGPTVTFTGWDVELTTDFTGSKSHDRAGLERKRPPLRYFHRFLAVGTDTADPATAAVCFDPGDVSLMEFQGVHLLRSDLSATIEGREITIIDNRPGLDAVEELAAEIDRPDLRPETLLIGVGGRWHRILAADRVVGSLLLATAPNSTANDRPDPAATITVAVPDLLDAVIAVEGCIGRRRQPLLAVSSHYVQQPNEIGADHDVGVVTGALAPLIFPSPGLAPGAVRALVFGTPPFR